MVNENEDVVDMDEMNNICDGFCFTKSQQHWKRLVLFILIIIYLTIIIVTGSTVSNPLNGTSWGPIERSGWVVTIIGGLFPFILLVYYWRGCFYYFMLKVYQKIRFVFDRLWKRYHTEDIEDSSDDNEEKSDQKEDEQEDEEKQNSEKEVI
jgi:hypothetical protein